MKKILTCLLVLIFSFSLVACGETYTVDMDSVKAAAKESVISEVNQLSWGGGIVYQGVTNVSYLNVNEKSNNTFEVTGFVTVSLKNGPNSLYSNSKKSAYIATVKFNPRKNSYDATCETGDSFS